MKIWIQRHDYSSDEKDCFDVDQAKHALASFDWKSELTKRDQPDIESCDPGLGLVKDDGSILHICPQNDESCYVHYHYTVTSKLFGFIPKKSQQSHFIEACSIEKAKELIQQHFEGNRDQILATK